MYPDGDPICAHIQAPLQGCSVPKGIVALVFGAEMPTALMLPMGLLPPRPGLCLPPEMMQRPPDARVFWDRAVCLAFTVGFASPCHQETG